MIYIIKQVPHEGPGLFGQLLDQTGRAYRTLEMYRPPIIWPDPGQAEGLLILGGPMGVSETDKHPFLIEEEKFVLEVIRLNKPVLGICLGAQMIAKALGAKVYSGPEKEIGWYPLKLTPEGKGDRLFKRFDEETAVFQWHGDTFSLPGGACRLAGSHLFENQAFRLGDKVYALQFHLEVTEKMIEEWLEINEEEVAVCGIDPRQVISGNRSFLAVLEKSGERFFREFCKLLT